MFKLTVPLFEILAVNFQLLLDLQYATFYFNKLSAGGFCLLESCLQSCILFKRNAIFWLIRFISLGIFIRSQQFEYFEYNGCKFFILMIVTQYIL